MTILHGFWRWRGHFRDRSWSGRSWGRGNGDSWRSHHRLRHGVWDRYWHLLVLNRYHHWRNHRDGGHHFRRHHDGLLRWAHVPKDIVEYVIAPLLNSQEEGLHELATDLGLRLVNQSAGNLHENAPVKRVLRVHRVDLCLVLIVTERHNLRVDPPLREHRLHGSIAAVLRQSERARVGVKPVQKFRRAVEHGVVLVHERVAHHVRGSRRLRLHLMRARVHLGHLHGISGARHT
mmetsp:Transcript_26284/g.57029  ORF Transcript_26284/g.57029 Transcript_26284/m.57029 type:complete len:233 (+) Transcript_26284:779-1477(+)